MEVLGLALEGLGVALTSVATGATTLGVAAIVAVSVLIYLDKVTIGDLKELFKKDKWR